MDTRQRATAPRQAAEARASRSLADRAAALTQTYPAAFKISSKTLINWPDSIDRSNCLNHFLVYPRSKSGFLTLKGFKVIGFFRSKICLVEFGEKLAVFYHTSSHFSRNRALTQACRLHGYCRSDPNYEIVLSWGCFWMLAVGIS